MNEPAGRWRSIVSGSVAQRPRGVAAATRLGETSPDFDLGVGGKAEAEAKPEFLGLLALNG